MNAEEARLASVRGKRLNIAREKKQAAIKSLSIEDQAEDEYQRLLKNFDKQVVERARAGEYAVEYLTVCSVIKQPDDVPWIRYPNRPTDRNTPQNFALRRLSKTVQQRGFFAAVKEEWHGDYIEEPDAPTYIMYRFSWAGNEKLEYPWRLPE